MPRLIKIAETKDLTPGQAAAFDLEGQRIALFNVEGLIMPSATVARTVVDRCRKATFKAPRSPAPGTARISI
jgi:hypothetical protein